MNIRDAQCNSYSDVAVKAEGLSKIFKLYKSPKDRLKEALSPIRCKYHQDFYALRDVSFEVNKGDTVGILGVNGSGKSTLLKIISGILMPTGGSVTVKGKVSALLELGAGFNPELTGIENIYFNGTLQGFSRNDIDQKIDSILAFAEIGDFVYQPVKRYSSGMFVRLAFSMATIIDPDILIVDESLSVGDVFFQQKCYKRLEELRTQGVTILFVTHGVGDVMQFCDKAILLHNGCLEYSGAPDKTVRRYLQRSKEDQFKKYQPSLVSESIEETVDQIFFSNAEDFVWPEFQHFHDISNVDIVSNGKSRCTRVALCDEKLMASRAFLQGKIAYISFEFEVISHINVPIAGIVIRNSKNILVHGKSMMFYDDMKLPDSVRSGKLLRFTFGVELSLGIGEYTVDVGLSTVTKEDYNNRGNYTFSQMASKTERLCALSGAANFTVIQKPLYGGNFDHLHIGVCNMKSNCNMSVI